jgi:formylglycine-generating enzyme required for sulfatase activity
VRIMFIFSMLLWSGFANAENRFALVIGNGAYFAKQKGINDLGTLTNPKHDAEDMANLLKGFGFILVDHQGENKPLIDATKQQMDAAIDKFLEKLSISADAVGWFYYSGHGVYLKDLKRSNESANYLLPIGQNFLASDPATIKYNAVNAHLLKERLQNATAKDKLMILDACRDKLELSESKGFSGGEEFRPMDPEHGLMVVHATLHSYSSFENPKERNGNFTKQLLLALKQQSNQRISRAISVGIEKLKEANQQLDPKYRQHPRVEGILSQDFCLADCQTNLDPQIQAKQKELDEREKKLKETKKADHLLDSKEKELAERERKLKEQEEKFFSIIASQESNTQKPEKRLKGEKKLEEDSTQKKLPKTFTNSIGMEFVLIPTGSFMMKKGGGTGPTEHLIEIEKPFYLGKYEVTQKQYQSLMKNNPSNFKGSNNPVENVSWNNAQTFISKLNSKEGTNKYRLPTSVEWEYAEKAGSEKLFSFGDCFSTDQVNYNGHYPSDNCPKGIYRNKTLPVGSLAKNDFGLYDMYGNVWEWTCSDHFDEFEDNYSSDEAYNAQEACSQNPSRKKIGRGGSWFSAADYVHWTYDPSWSPIKGIIGFRVAFIPEPQPQKETSYPAAAPAQ